MLVFATMNDNALKENKFYTTFLLMNDNALREIELRNILNDISIMDDPLKKKKI
jgi:hypothetical protein